MFCFLVWFDLLILLYSILNVYLSHTQRCTVRNADKCCPKRSIKVDFVLSVQIIKYKKYKYIYMNMVQRANSMTMGNQVQMFTIFFFAYNSHVITFTVRFNKHLIK